MFKSTRLYLTRPKPDNDGAEVDDRERVLSRLKANYAGAGARIKLRAPRRRRSRVCI